MSSPTAAIIGSTGLVGSYILTTCLSESSPWSKITTISRRTPKSSAGPKLNAIIEPDTTKWTSTLSSISPTPSLVFSSLGTTRAQAGGLANQWKIDHDLNVELVQASKAAGVKNFVFISSAGTRSMLSSRVPYSKMKIGVEDSIKEAGFETAVIVRPGMIFGDREVPHTGMPFLMGVVHGIGRVFGQGAEDAIGVEAEVIAKAAVAAARIAEEGKAPSKYWVLEQADIIRMGRTEWKE